MRRRRQSRAWESRDPGTAASAAAPSSGPAARPPPASCLLGSRAPRAIGSARLPTATRSRSASPPVTRRRRASCSGRALRPDPAARAAAVPAEVFGVRYEVAEDEDFARIVRRGSIEAVPEESHTRPCGDHRAAAAATEYWYRFKWGTSVSDVGRTRTAPAARLAHRTRCVRVRVVPELHERPLPRVSRPRSIRRTSSWWSTSATTSTRGPAPVPRCACTSPPARSARSPTIGRATRSTRPIRPAGGARRGYPWLITWDDHEFENNYANL